MCYQWLDSTRLHTGYGSMSHVVMSQPYQDKAQNQKYQQQLH